MKDIVIFFLAPVLGITVYFYFVYRVFSKVIEKEKRDAEIDNEEVPEGIHAR